MIHGKLLFEFNDTRKIKLGKDLHIPRIRFNESWSCDINWSVESILVGMEESGGASSFMRSGVYYCKINGQTYSFRYQRHKCGGASIKNIKFLETTWHPVK